MKTSQLKAVFYSTCGKKGKGMVQALPDHAPVKRHLAAFTLIELLVVVLIIGILAAVAVPQYQQAVAKTHVVEAAALLRRMLQAEELYYLSTGKDGHNFTDLDIEFPTSSYYEYGITGNHASRAFAMPKKDGLPVLEFHGYRNPVYPNKNWCQIWDARNKLSTQGQKKALEICKKLGGKRDSSITFSEYYLLP